MKRIITKLNPIVIILLFFTITSCTKTINITLKYAELNVENKMLFRNIRMNKLLLLMILVKSQQIQKVY
jgi:hypothetical protein